MDLAQNDDRIWLLTGDLGFNVLETFADRFPDRFVNAGVAEQNMLGVAAGLASCSKIVFVYSIGNFNTLRCLEQIRNDVCYHRLCVTVVSVGGGYAYGPLGASHHATEDLAIMRSLPCMTVIAPGDLLEAQLATCAAVKSPGPHYLRLGRAGESPVHHGDIPFAVGKAIMIQDGLDLTLISTGTMLGTSLNVARRLTEEGVSVRILSMHTLKPLDTDSVLAAARETAAIVTVEEHSVVGGLGGAVAEFLSEYGEEKTKFKRIGLPATFCDRCGSQDYLLAESGLSEESIFRSVKLFLET